MLDYLDKSPYCFFLTSLKIFKYIIVRFEQINWIYKPSFLKPEIPIFAPTSIIEYFFELFANFKIP